MKSLTQHDNFFAKKGATRKGAALVVVLVLLVLMLGIVLAFFSQSILQKKISKSSATQAAADLLAVGAVNTIVGDLKAEIADGSKAGSNTWKKTFGSEEVTLYRPDSPAKATPEIALGGSLNSQTILGSNLENLLKISKSGLPFYTNGPSRAAAVSTKAPSLDGRAFLSPRWNQAMLLPAKDVDHTPQGDFPIPDWILVNRDGSNATALKKWTPSLKDRDITVGRYAYAIYNEGGMLDANVAGYPQIAKSTKPTDTSIVDQTLGKGSVAYADLSVVGLSTDQIENLIKWRNDASLSGGGGGASAGFLKFATHNQNNFISPITAGTALKDKNFISRQQLIDFFTKKIGGGSPSLAILNVLPYLGTFSRSLNRPSYVRPQAVDSTVLGYESGAPKIASDTYSGSGSWPLDGGNSGYGSNEPLINPAFSTIRIQNDGLHSDGSKFDQGDVFVKKRFPLDRLLWVTYKGPSKNLSANDPLRQEYLKQGITNAFIDEGTQENIKANFGLDWRPGTTDLGGYWSYNHGLANTIGVLSDVVKQGRDPDFFELLKAGTNVAAIAKGMQGIHADYKPMSGQENLNVNDNLKFTTRIDDHILQLGANIIDQVGADNYPTRIVFDDGVRVRSFWGVVDLPYWYGMVNVPVVSASSVPPPPDGWTTYTGAAPSPAGTVAVTSVPIVWNPHTAPVAPLANGLDPQKLRICVSSANLSTPSLPAASSPGLNFFLKNKSGSTTVVQNQVTTKWNLGSLTNVKTGGVIDMPAEGTVGNTAMYFNNLPSLYRQPTPLMIAGVPAGSSLSVDSGNLLNAAGFTNGIPELGSSDKFLGFYAGKADLIKSQLAGTPPTMTNYPMNRMDASPPPDGSAKGYTVSLEFQDGSTWIPYKQIAIGNTQLIGGPVPPVRITNGTPTASSVRSTWSTDVDPKPEPLISRSAHFAFDPRTIRWNTNGDISMFPLEADGTMPSLRPGAAVYPAPSKDSRSQSLGGMSKDSYMRGQYIKDADSIVRRPMGAYVPGAINATTTTGLPMATVAGSGEKYNRPLLLHRPFRNVAELGYVFTDTPWRNIDFFTPESGFSGLLDVFCISEDERQDGLIAGKVDLNGRQAKVFKAIFKGAYRDDNVGKTGYTGGEPEITDGQAESLATAWLNRTKAATAGKGPVTNVGDVVGRYATGASNGGASSAPYDGFSADLTTAISGSDEFMKYVQRIREAPIRALTSAGQAGTWNLFIDLIAQVGKYPPNSGGLDEFLVEGQQRYWVHVAIDRESGKVIDQQIEVVNE